MRASEPTRGAAEQSWSRAPGLARGLRVASWLLPIVFAWLAVRGVSHWFWHPEGWTGMVVWLVQAVAVAATVSFATERVARHLLPLAALFEVSLVFPDTAPSRFSTALRAGTVKKLAAREGIASGPLGEDANSTAVAALEMVTAVGDHDRLTRGHTERVRAYADLIAVEIGLSDDDRAKLAWGVLLHDLGKITVPAEILNKSEKLTDDEWQQLRNHPAAAIDLLAPLQDWLGPWLLAASEHHERWDGTGYPLGLAGYDISLAGRICAVADAYDVITSKRSYKEPMSAEAARAELVRCAGAQFDPDIVRAFLNAGLGHRFSGGPLAWLAEVPTIGQLGSVVTTGGTAVSGAVSAGASAFLIGATSVLTGTTAGPPEQLAFDSIDVVADSGEQVVAPESTTTTEFVDTAAPTTAKMTNVPGSSSTTSSETTASTDTETPNSGPAATGPTTTRLTTTAPSGPTSAVAPTTTTAAPATTTTTAPPPTTSSPAPGSVTLQSRQLWLANGATSADTPLQSQMPFVSSSMGGSTGNYDTDRNSVVGRQISRDGAGLDVTDPTKRAAWRSTMASGLQLDGSARLHLWIGEKDLEGGEVIGVEVALQVCNPTCSTIATGAWSDTSSAGALTHAKVDLSETDLAIPAGADLRLIVVASDSVSDTDVTIAYGSGDATSRLKLPLDD
ncbi:MAG: HD-GYP domain-containing protein [Acidimicrobiales bacterium]